MNARTHAPQSDETELSLSIHDDGAVFATPDGDTVTIETLKVYRVEGEEAISKPFRYAIDLVHVNEADVRVPLFAAQVLGKDATLEIRVTDGAAMMRRVHGIVDEFIVDEGLSSNDTTYRVTLVPRLAMLAHNRQNRIHATSTDQTLEQIIANKLLSSGPDYGPSEKDHRAMLDDGEFRIDIDAARVPLKKLSHVAQFNETDLDFVRRLCERHGVYFFFASNAGDTAGMVVFGNTNTPFGVVRFEGDAPVRTTAAPGDSNPAGWGPFVGAYPTSHRLDIELVLTGATGLAAGSTDTPGDDGPARVRGALYEFTSVHRPVPARVNVIGERTNGESVSPDSTGSGVHADYGTHVSTTEAGNAFATIRSQEIRAASRYSIGLTNSPCVAPGRTFTKKPDGNPPTAPGAAYPAAYSKYLVTEVAVEVRQAHAGLNLTIDGEAVQTGFANRFRCIEFDEAGDFVYRPPRVTPVPRLHGVQTAWVGTGDTGEDARPVLDENGAYHIYSPFLDERAALLDERAGADSMPAIDKLSKAVRKGEPYAGDGVGMHFPLKRDTEVLVAYRNGDPDRPVIAAAMPGPLDHASPVTGENPTSHVIETSSGARFAIHDDTDARSRIALHSRGASEMASYVRLGKADTTNGSGPGTTGPGTTGSRTLEDHYAENVVTVAEDEGLDGIALYTADHIREAAKRDKVTEVHGSVRVEAGEDITGRSVQRHLLRGRRMVIVSGAAADEPAEGATIDIDGENHSFDDDDMRLSSKGNLYIDARNYVYRYAHEVVTEVGGDKFKRTNGEFVSHHLGESHRYVRGDSHALVLGAATNVRVGHAALGALGGWARLWGPVSGRVYAGIAYYLWPQVFVLQGMLTLTNTRVEIKSTNTNVKNVGISTKSYFIRLIRSKVDVETGAIKSGIFSSYKIL